MCRFVWIGTPQPADCPLVAGESTSRLHDVADDDPVRAHFAAPFVYAVGAHEGCGCGFHSDWLCYEGVETVADSVALAGALTDEEREDFAQEQRSRAVLHGVVVRAAAEGPVEVYSCWAGDESVPAIDTRPASADWITASLCPFDERVHYVVTSARP